MIQRQRPLIVINFKCYTEASGKNAVKLAKQCASVAKKSTNVEIILAVQAADLYPIHKNVSVPLFAQHLDTDTPGAHTGHTIASTLHDAGATGTLLNHTEHRIPLDDLPATISIAQHNQLTTLVCAATIKEAIAIARYAPDMIAIEPPELIGGNVPVTSVKPSSLQRSISTLQEHYPHGKILVGAGITNGKDLAQALALGANGVLLSSHIVLAKNPGKKLQELVSACK